VGTLEEVSLRHGPNQDPDAEEPEQPNTPSRGVKDDISKLTETFTRRLWDVASFLAPPPESSTLHVAATAEGEDEERKEGGGGDDDGVEGAQSPRITGIRSDLAGISGRVRGSISILQNNPTVAEISVEMVLRHFHRSCYRSSSLWFFCWRGI
jgi:hypothetical protein